MAGDSVAVVSVSFRAQVAEFQQDMRKITQATHESVSQMSKSLSGLESSFTRAFAVIGGGAAITAGIRSAVKLGDEYNSLNARLKNITASTNDYGQVSQRLLEITQKNGVALRDTVSVFQQLQRTTKELGVSNNDMIKLTDIVQKLGVIGGSSSEQMKNGMLQFSQALAGGTVHAEEFNSILENMPEVANRIAKGMGVSMGQLRSMVKDQKVAAADLFDALMKQKNTIESEFGKMPQSVERSWMKLQTSVQQTIGELDKSFGMTKTWAKGFDSLAEAIANAGSEFAQWNSNTLTGANGKQVSISDFLGTEAKAAGLTVANGLNFIKGNYDGPGGTKDDRFGGKAARETWLMHQARIDAERRQVYGLETGTYSDVRKSVVGPPSRNDYYGPSGMRQEWIDAQSSVTKAKRAPAGPDKKTLEHMESERKHIAATIEGYRVQNRELDLKLSKQDDGKAKLEHEIRLIKAGTLGRQEQNKAIKDMTALYEEAAKKEKQLEVQKAQKKQGEKIGDLLADIKQSRDALAQEVAGRKSLNGVLSEERRLRELIAEGNKGSAQNAKDLLQAQQDLEALKTEKLAAESTKATEKAAEEAAKYADKLGDVVKAENEAAEAAMRKARGEDNVSSYVKARREVEEAANDTYKKQAELLEKINQLLAEQPNNASVQADKAKIEADINKIYADRAKALEDIAAAEAKQEAANAVMKEQKEILDQVKRSAVDLRTRILTLDDAYRKGKLTTKQYTDALTDLQDEGFKKAKAASDSFASSITRGLERALTSGKSFKETIKDIGKELALLAARKLLFQPLEQGISSLAMKFFGPKYGVGPQQPGINPTGGVPYGVASNGGAGGVGPGGTSLPSFGVPYGPPTSLPGYSANYGLGSDNRVVLLLSEILDAIRGQQFGAMNAPYGSPTTVSGYTKTGGGLGSFLGGLPGRIGGALQAPGMELFNMLGGLGSAGMNLMRGNLGGALGGLGTSVGGGMGLFSSLLKFLPGFADGGMYDPGMGPIRVGERGPELFYPGQSGYIQPFGGAGRGFSPYMSSGMMGGMFDGGFSPFMSMNPWTGGAYGRGGAATTYGTGAGTYGQPNLGNSNGWTYREHADVMSKTFADLAAQKAEWYRTGKISNPREMQSDLYWSNFYRSDAMSTAPQSRLSVDPGSIDWATYNSMGGSKYVSDSARARDAQMYPTNNPNAMWGGFAATPLVGSSMGGDYGMYVQGFGGGGGGGGFGGDLPQGLHESSWTKTGMDGMSYNPIVGGITGGRTVEYMFGPGGMRSGIISGGSTGAFARPFGGGNGWKSVDTTRSMWSALGETFKPLSYDRGVSEYGGNIQYGPLYPGKPSYAQDGSYPAYGGARVAGVDPMNQTLMDILRGYVAQGSGFSKPGPGIDPNYVPEQSGNIFTGARTQPGSSPLSFGPDDAEKYLRSGVGAFGTGMGSNITPGDLVGMLQSHWLTATSNGRAFEALVDQLNARYKQIVGMVNRGFPESEGRQRAVYEPMTAQSYRDTLDNYFRPMMNASSNPAFHWSSMPRMRKGGRVDKGEAVITGDAGLELFVPHENGSIIPNNALPGLSGGNVNVTLVNSTGTPMAPPVVEKSGDDIRITLVAVANDIRRGGPVASALMDTFNTKAKTVRRS